MSFFLQLALGARSWAQDPFTLASLLGVLSGLERVEGASPALETAESGSAVSASGPGALPLSPGFEEAIGHEFLLIFLKEEQQRRA